MSVRILPESDIQVLAAFARDRDLFDRDDEATFVADIKGANRRLFDETYRLTTEPEPAEPISSVARRPAGEAVAAFAVVVYNAGPISEETEVALARIGKALVAEYVAEKTRLQ